MEVDDDLVSALSSISEGDKFVNFKAFVTAAREFEDTHSDAAVNLMTRYLGLISSSCDLSVFAPGRSEVCAFFSSLWRVMGDGRGPHWAGVAVLSRACMDPHARHALTHTYKFLPILSRLLTDAISDDKKIKILSVMQDITHHIKISWQESYLSTLLKQLTTWIQQMSSEPQNRLIAHKSLTVLVNVCYGNLPAIYLLMRTVDTKDFVVYLLSLKDGGFGGVVVCRLLLCLAMAARGAGAVRPADVHSYLCCAMRTFRKALGSADAEQLLQCDMFVAALAADDALRPHALTYPGYAAAVADAMPDLKALCRRAQDGAEPDASEPRHALALALRLLTTVVELDLYSLREQHAPLLTLSLQAGCACLPESLQLFAALVSQYRDEGSLPAALTSQLGAGLTAVLVPPALEPGKAGLHWLRAVSVLCEAAETAERVLRDVTPDAFEDTLYSVLRHADESGAGAAWAADAAAAACRAALALAPRAAAWDSALGRMLTQPQVRRQLRAALAGGDGARRLRVLRLVRHHRFPQDRLAEVFGEEGAPAAAAGPVAPGPAAPAEWGPAASPAQEEAIDCLIARLGDALSRRELKDVATSSVMELYGYKTACLEQRLQAQAAALQCASEQLASLQHAAAALQAAGRAHQDALYAAQLQRERDKSSLAAAAAQLSAAAAAGGALRAKLAAERLQRSQEADAAAAELRARAQALEEQLAAAERAAAERQRQTEAEVADLGARLEQQTTKNTELAAVLTKFEERVRARERRLEEAAAAEQALRRDAEVKDATIKQLEKTVLEREQRLYQLSEQLDELKRVQEMVAKLMSKTTKT